MSSENSYIRTKKNINKMSAQIEGEDSQCKFEDLDKIDELEVSVKKQSVMMIEEETFIEDEEESKRSDFVK